MSRKIYQPEKNLQVEENPLTVGLRDSEDLPDEGIDVLHVDDSTEFVELTAIYLRRENDCLNVKTETDPVEALERLEGDEEEFDCVISDCSMAGMDGVELRSEVRKKNPDLPFVFFTGTPLSQFSDEVMDDEATGHTQKGIGVKQFSNLAGWIFETVE